MPCPRTPPNISRILEDIAHTPTPQHMAKTTYAYPAPQDLAKGKANQCKDRAKSRDRQPDTSELLALPLSTPASRVPSRGVPENVYQGFTNRDTDVFRDLSPYPTDVPPTVPVVLSNIFTWLNLHLEVIPNPMQAQDVHHLHLANLENAFDHLSTTVQTNKDGSCITTCSASGSNKDYQITEHEAAVSTILLLRPKGINWLALSSFLDTVAMLTPFKGTLEDFKSFWQNVVNEGHSVDEFQPFIDKYNPDTHRDLRAQLKQLKECHQQVSLSLNGE